MTNKILTTIAAAGFAAMTMIGAAEAGPRHTSIHFSGPGWGVHIGTPKAHRHKHRKAHRHARRCRPVFARRHVWTPRGWVVRKVRVGTDCYKVRRHSRHYYRGW